MIRTFSLRDFKGHRDTQLELGRFTMLVGDNASGKSSVLEALALQARLGNKPTDVYREGDRAIDLVRRGSDGRFVLTSHGQRAGQDWTDILEFVVGRKSRSVALAPEDGWRLSLDVRVSNETWDAAVWRDEQYENGEGSVDELPSTIGSAAAFGLRAESIAGAAYSDQREVHIHSDGTNTAVALATMKLEDDEAFQRVEQGLRTLIPSVERIRIRRATVPHPSIETAVVGSKLYFDFRGAPDVPAEGASHGTLIVLALLTILHRANRPNVILLDDFDHALHPRAQMELMRMIKQLLALDEFHDVQIVATTHSPYMLDELDASEVYAFALRDDGSIASKRLSDHPEAASTKGVLKAGQL